MDASQPMVLDSLLAVIFYEKSGTHLRSVITGHWQSKVYSDAMVTCAWKINEKKLISFALYLFT